MYHYFIFLKTLFVLFYKQYMTMESESGNYQNLGAAVVIEEGRFHTIIIGEGKRSKGLIKLLVYLLSIFF